VQITPLRLKLVQINSHAPYTPESQYKIMYWCCESKMRPHMRQLIHNVNVRLTVSGDCILTLQSFNIKNRLHFACTEYLHLS
jgi:hypothetical protein